MCLVAQLCPTLCDPINCSLPGSPVLGISQAIILEWVAISYSRDLPDPGIEPKSPVSPALAGGLLTTEPPGKPINSVYTWSKLPSVPRFSNRLISFPPSESSCYLPGVGRSPPHLGSLIFFCGYSTLPTTSNLIFLKYHVPSGAAPFQVSFPSLSNVHASLSLPNFP